MRQHAGLYQDKTYAPEFKNILLLTASADSEMLTNWECFAKRLGLDWMVMVGQDQTQGEHIFLTRGFGTAATACTLKSVLDVLHKTNLDIVFSDPDNVFKSDPFLPSLSLGSMMRSGKYDYIYARDIKSEGGNIQTSGPAVYHQEAETAGIGFYFVACGHKQRIVQTIYETSVRWCERRPSLDDRDSFWDSLVATPNNNNAEGGDVCFRRCDDDACSGVNESMVLNYCDMSPWEYRGSVSPESAQEPRMVSCDADVNGPQKDKVRQVATGSPSQSPNARGDFLIRNNAVEAQVSATQRSVETGQSVSYWVCDLQEPRIKEECPSLVRVHGWSARIGNHFFQISQAIIFALMCGSSTVLFPSPIYAEEKALYQDQAGMLAMPPRLELDMYRVNRSCFIPVACPRNLTRVNWYAIHCNGFPAWRYRQVMQAFLRPNLGQELLTAEAKPRKRYEDTVLTVHLRGDDVQLKRTYALNQPPCRMYHRILSNHHYIGVTVVYAITKLIAGNRVRGTPACFGYFQHLGKKMIVRMYRNSVVEDFATLMRARNLALSFSSFALSAAILSKEVRVLYRQGNAAWDTVLHSILNCELWPGVVMYEYNVNLDQLPEDSARWLQDVPDENITGPFKCDGKNHISKL